MKWMSVLIINVIFGLVTFIAAWAGLYKFQSDIYWPNVLDISAVLVMGFTVIWIVLIHAKSKLNDVLFSIDVILPKANDFAQLP